MATKLHIDNWINRAEPDFLTMFIKAWIPLNAWYYTEFTTKSDTVAIEKLCGTKNKIRNRIESLLINDDSASKLFKSNLAKLHSYLENRTVNNYGEKVSFKNIKLSDRFPSPVTDADKSKNIYKAIPHKTNGFRVVIITSQNKTLMDKTFNPYDVNNFLLDNQYIALPNKKIKEKIKKCFEEINPNNPIDITTNSKIKSEFILLDNSIKFKNDTELIAQSIIQILYTLRCLLFHGELDPTEINQPLYEYGYNILKELIKELK